MIEFVRAILEIGKDLRPDYIESWLKGEVKDFDMDMILIDEKKNRSHNYKKLDEEK